MLRTIPSYSTPFIHRVPEITKRRAGFMLAFLFIETMARYEQDNHKLLKPSGLISLISQQVDINDINVPLGVLKSAQMIACLGSTRFFRSYVVSLPVSSIILLIGVISPFLKAQFMKNLVPKSMHFLINATLLSGNIGVKVVNSFAIGLLARRTFSKISRPEIIMIITTIAILALSSWNIWKGWNDTSMKTI